MGVLELTSLTPSALSHVTGWLSWWELSRLALASKDSRGLCSCAVRQEADASAQRWTASAGAAVGGFCGRCDCEHSYENYFPQEGDWENGVAGSACVPDVRILQFGGLKISPVYRAFLYWRYPQWTAYEIVTSARGDQDSPFAPDPWISQEAALPDNAERRRNAWKLLSSALSVGPAREEAKAAMVSFFAGDLRQQHSWDMGHEEDFYSQAHTIVRVISADYASQQAKYDIEAMRQRMRDCSWPELDSLKDAIALELASCAFLLYRVVGRVSEREVLWRKLTELCAQGLRAALKRALLQNAAAALVGWADEILKDVYTGELLNEYAWLMNCWSRVGEELLVKSRGGKDNWDAPRVFKEIFYFRSEAYRNAVQGVGRGDDGVRVLRVDADHAFHEVFEKYASSPTCHRFEVFSGRPGQPGRVAVYLTGGLV